MVQFCVHHYEVGALVWLFVSYNAFNVEGFDPPDPPVVVVAFGGGGVVSSIW